MEGNLEEGVRIAAQQVENGAQMIDVNFDDGQRTRPRVRKRDTGSGVSDSHRNGAVDDYFVRARRTECSDLHRRWGDRSSGQDPIPRLTDRSTHAVV